MSIAPLVSLTLIVLGCTSVRVRPLDPALAMTHVCIQQNSRVVVADFISVVRDGFDRHGIATEVYTGQAPDRCEFILTYTARQSWDVTFYLSHAELTIERRGGTVASAEYHLRGKGGLSLMKWQSTRTKMDPVIDELLKRPGR